MQLVRHLFIAMLALHLTSTMLLAQPADRPVYVVQPKPFPKGTQFADLLPVTVADFKRISFKEPQPGLDGEALYKSGEQEIFLLFSVAQNQQEVDEIYKTIQAELHAEPLSQSPQTRVDRELGYIRLIGKTIAFYAWNRGLYCFSADSKGGNQLALDRFMQAFPY